MVDATYLNDAILRPLVAIVATIAGIGGIFVIQSFFGHKLKELFEDRNYQILFFLAAGYFIYALGEVSYYLSKDIFLDKSDLGIADLYYSIGLVCVVISFFMFTRQLAQRKPKNNNLTITYGIAALLLITFIFKINTQGDAFFTYFYPIMSAIAVTFGITCILNISEFESIRVPLELFTLANTLILFGDIIYTLNPLQFSADTIQIIYNPFYIIGYATSFFAFITLRNNLTHMNKK